MIVVYVLHVTNHDKEFVLKHIYWCSWIESITTNTGGFVQ